MPLELPEEIASQIPEEQLKDGSIQRYNSLPELIKGHIELDKYRGRSIALPNGEGKPEEIEAWTGQQNEKLKAHGLAISKLADGPPENPDGYQFKLEGFDPEVVNKDEGLKFFREKFHQRGVSPALAQGLLEDFRDFVEKTQPFKPDVEILEDEDKIGKVHAEVFKQDAGEFIGKRDQIIEELKAEVPELPDFLEGMAPYGSPWLPNKQHPAMIKLLRFVADMKAQDSSGFAGAGGGAAAEADYEEAQKIKFDSSHPEHAAYMKEASDGPLHQKVDLAYQRKFGKKEVQ